jgi:uncharacterized repeat protein (TIGR01451 family)
MNPSPPIDAQSPQARSGGSRRFSRTWIFGLFALFCVLVTLIYVIRVVRRDTPSRKSGSTREVSTFSISTRPWPTAGPTVLFSSRVSDDRLRQRLSVVPLRSPDGPRWLTRLVCERVYFAGGRGICLGEGGGTAPLEPDILSTHAYVFGTDFQIRHNVKLGGFPSRVRVSPDGRYGAVTVFVAGHSYAEAGFSTETTLIDLERGTKIGNLEAFTVTRNGKPFRSVNVNFWGVTFAPDSDRFYATLGTGGSTYLVEGSVRGRRMETRRENVECPSLSPDGKRLAFKKRVSNGFGDVWRFHVLELATMVETPLAELRSLDDQIEWLDDRQILYDDQFNVWTVPADGTGQPTKFLTQATSPTVLSKALPASAPDGDRNLSAGNSVTLRGTDLAVAVTATPALVRVGGPISHTVTVTNHGPADATDLRVDQILGAGLILVGTPTSTNPGHGYGCSVREDERRVSCDTRLLPNGATWTISFNVRATAAGTPTTRVVVSGAEPDPRVENDSSEARTTVQPGR